MTPTSIGEVVTTMQAGQTGLPVVIRRSGLAEETSLSEGQILVSACGRSCNIETQATNTMQSLQLALQHSLRMEDQNFHICDVNGTLLTSDGQVQEAVARNLTPFSASLTDKALHSIENRREELAQMQWKLIRDQMTSATNQTSQLARQVNELQFHLQGQQRELQSSIELVREDLYKALENERASIKNELTALSDQVTAAVMMVNSERSKRELSIQGFEKHLHGVCDMLDGERNTRRQDMAMHMQILDQLRTKLESEKQERDVIEDKLREAQNRNQEARDELMLKFQAQVDNMIRVKGESEVSFADVRTRFQEIEDRCATIEGHMAESSSWHAQNLERMGERHEGVSGKVEVMRLATEDSKSSIKKILDRMSELDSAFKHADGEQREMVMKERELRDDHVRRTQNSMLAAQCTQISELEKRLNSKLERESAEREKNFQWMIDQVTSMLLERKDLQCPDLRYGRKESDKNLAGSFSTRSDPTSTSKYASSILAPVASESAFDDSVSSPRVVSSPVSSAFIPRVAVPTRGPDRNSKEYARSVSPASQEFIAAPGTLVPGAQSGLSLTISAASLPGGSGTYKGGGSASYPTSGSPRTTSTLVQVRAPTPTGSRTFTVQQVPQAPQLPAFQTPRSNSAQFA
mmetsp:Transcript_87160/g.144320  ORF Transcript_87160/g.144320 Transcript_87160/m.144320 type:complete len:637 (-) Transcript_87160:149-2059(-)